MHLIDCFAHSNRWRNRHPAEKALFAGGFMALSLFLPLPFPLVILAFTSALIIWGAGIPAGVYLRVIGIPAVFIFAGTAPLFVGLDLTNGLHLSWAPDGGQRAAGLASRALAATSCLNFLALTTPAYEWMPFLRRIRIPAAIVDIALLVYRLLFIFAERLTSMQMAQSARLGYATSRNTLRSSGMLGTNLFLRTLLKARRMELAMAARSFTGELPLLPFDHRPSAAVLAAITLLLGLTLAAGLLYMRGGFHG